MAYFNKNEDLVICNKEDIIFNFDNVVKTNFTYLDIVDNAELSVFNIENMDKYIKNNYNQKIINISIKNLFKNTEYIFLKINYISEGFGGVFKGKIGNYNEDSEVGMFIKEEFDNFLKQK